MKNFISILFFLFGCQVNAGSKVSFFEDLEAVETQDVYVLGSERAVVSYHKVDPLDFRIVLDGRVFEFKEHLSALNEDLDVDGYVLNQSVVDPEKFKVRIPFGVPREISIMGKKLVKRDFIYFVFGVDGSFEKEVFRWPEKVN